MKKKLQVFISSTYRDLMEERQTAVEAVLEAGHIPAGMEFFYAGEEQMDTIKKCIDESDVYLLILGGRYGTIEKKSGKSYTELEYEYALSKNMPNFAIVIQEDALQKKIEDNGYEKVVEVNNREKYEKFKEKIMNKIIVSFKDKTEIKCQVHKQINYFDKEYNLSGWIKGEYFESVVYENKELKNEISYLKQNTLCDKERKDQCIEELGNVYRKDKMAKKYVQFLKDSNEVYILVGDLDFLLESSGSEQLKLIKKLGERCKILCRQRKISSLNDEIRNLYEEIIESGIRLRCYSMDSNENIKNIKGQFRVDLKKHIESLIICKKNEKYQLLNFQNQYMSEIFMREVKQLFEKSEDVLLG